MTWSDLRAFVGHLPMSSHFWRKEEPEVAARVVWAEGLAKPHVVVLGALHDLIEQQMFPPAGVEPIVKRLQDRALHSMQEETQEPVAPVKPVRRRKSAAEIRAQLERAQQRKGGFDHG